MDTDKTKDFTLLKTHNKTAKRGHEFMKRMNRKPQRRTNGEILLNAHRLINWDRQEQYGTPRKSFKRIASLWGAYLDKDLSAIDVCMMMALLKIAREAHCHKADNLIDAAGYIGLVGDLAASNE